MKLFVVLLCCAVASAKEYNATVNLTDPAGKTNVYGNVTFVQIDDGPVKVTGIVFGLGQGLHGFHVHEKADISFNCTGAGAHYNPTNKHHGAPTDDDRHVGDLGNIEAGPDGVAHINISDTVIRLTGPHSIMDRSIVVHADPDDLGKGAFQDSLTTGHAGKRSACGKIIHYEELSRGSNVGTSESTSELQQRRANNSTNEIKNVSPPSGSAPLYVSWILVLLVSAVLRLY